MLSILLRRERILKRANDRWVAKRHALVRGGYPGVPNGRPASEVDEVVRVGEPALGFPDVELRYYQGSLLALCGQKDVALRLLRSAIEQNYCSYEALEHDPAWRDLRGSPASVSYDRKHRLQKKFLMQLVGGK